MQVNGWRDMPMRFDVVIPVGPGGKARRPFHRLHNLPKISELRDAQGSNTGAIPCQHHTNTVSRPSLPAPPPSWPGAVQGLITWPKSVSCVMHKGAIPEQPHAN